MSQKNSSRFLNFFLLPNARGESATHDKQKYYEYIKNSKTISEYDKTRTIDVLNNTHEYYIDTPIGKIHTLVATNTTVRNAKTIFIIGGMGSSIIHCFRIGIYLYLMGYNFICFSYNGYIPKSHTSNNDTAKTKERTRGERSIMRAIDYLYKFAVDTLKIKAKNIVFLGHSLGGLFALHYAANMSSNMSSAKQKVITIGTPFTIQSAIKDIFKVKLNGFGLNDKFRGDHYINKLCNNGGHHLAFHSKEDKIVNFSHALEYQKYCAELLIYKGSHVDLIDIFIDPVLHLKLQTFINNSKLNKKTQKKIKK